MVIKETVTLTQPLVDPRPSLTHNTLKNVFSTLSTQKDNIYLPFCFTFCCFCPFENVSGLRSFQLFCLPKRQICFAEQDINKNKRTITAHYHPRTDDF